MFWLTARLPLYETILDRSRLISEQSGDLFPDWFGGIHLACQSHPPTHYHLNRGEEHGGSVFLHNHGE